MFEIFGKRQILALVTLATLLAVPLIGPDTAAAQPAPSFEASCDGLRAALEALAPDDEELITIDVVGELTAVEFDGVIAYLGMCSSPDPQVLCITYDTGGLEVGDRAVLSGAYSRRGPDHILLDPCLHHPPD